MTKGSEEADTSSAPRSRNPSDTSSAQGGSNDLLQAPSGPNGGKEARPEAGSGPKSPLPVTNKGSDPEDPLFAMHSAEHVLSAVMRRDYGSLKPVETHLGAKKSKCDYRVDRPLSEDDLHGIEAAVNAEIDSDHPVSDRLVPADEARNRFDLSKVPGGAEQIRIVAIGDLDETPCSGDHVERTSEIGRFEIRSAEMRSENRIRIRYRLQNRVKGAR